MKKTCLLIILLGALFSASQWPDQLPEYAFDPNATTLSFEVGGLGMMGVKGKFTSFSGNMLYDGKNISSITTEITIDAQSINTNNDVRDGHLKSEIWLDVEHYPSIVFRSKKVLDKLSKHYMLGELTIHGVTKEVEFPFEMKGPMLDSDKKMTISVMGAFIVNRKDFGLNFSKVMDNGEVFVGDEIRITIQGVAVLNK